MKKVFRVHYYFDGSGYVDIEAESKEQAEERFFDGDFENEEEWGDQYNIENVTEPLEEKAH